MVLAVWRLIGRPRVHRSVVLCALYGTAFVFSTLCLAGSMVHITHGLTEQDVVHVAGAVLMTAASLSCLLAMVALACSCRRIASGAEAFAERVLLLVLGIFYLTASVFALANHQDYCLGRATPAAKLPSCAERRMGLIAGILAWGTIMALLGYNVYRTRSSSLLLQPSFETAEAGKTHLDQVHASYWSEAEMQSSVHHSQAYQTSLGRDSLVLPQAHELPPKPRGWLYETLAQLRNSLHHG
ncbi:hypothetical protein H4R34_001466 [Dimargaris verticillata]|uniref:Uncharacterized protein n=1 Tax=Dimargaris verticillata TaxID=2761393 RepID=A0A9W8B8F7_9FUNG|nr:hypothetical protein H4R34_001466 [Dimargaris verticillata]